jgi:hypothetical protein
MLLLSKPQMRHVDCTAWRYYRGDVIASQIVLGIALNKEMFWWIILENYSGEFVQKIASNDSLLDLPAICGNDSVAT